MAIQEAVTAPAGAAAPPPAYADQPATRGERVRLWGLALLAALLPFVINPWWYDIYYWPKVQLLYAGTGVLLFLTVWRSPGGWRRVFRSPLGMALACWLGAVGLATLGSVNPLLSVVGEDYRYEGLLTWLAYGALTALSACTVTGLARIRWLVGAVLAAATVMAAVGLAQHIGWAVVPEDFDRRGMARAWGTIGSPLALGAYLVLLLPLPISLYAQTTHPGWRWIYGAVVVLLYAALVATRTRAAWGAFVVAAGVWAVATGAERLRPAVRSLLILAAALAVVTPLVLLTSRLEVAHVLDRDSADSRSFLWRTTAPLIWQRPLLGWGPETLVQVYPDYGTPEFLSVFPRAAMERILVDRPHNDLLQQAVSTGLLGLAAYLWLWWTVFRTGWRAARRDLGGSARGTHAEAGAVAAGLLGGCAGYFSQLQFSFSYVSVAPVYWCLAGVVLSLEHLGRPAPADTSAESAISGT